MQNTAHPSRLVLIGSAASQAMSPGLWNPVLGRLGTGWTYEAWDVPPDGDLVSVRDRLLEPGIIAANVTMPHKHWAADAADNATEEVLLGGACNLLLRIGSTLFGHNTDIMAARSLLGGEFQRNVLLMGAGGAARAVLIALKGKAGTVTISDRDPRAMEELLGLAKELGMAARSVDWDEARGLASEASLLVNATPIGKSVSDGPVWGDGPLAPDAVVYDFVYAGHVTATIARARRLGARCIDGWDHLYGQAVAMVPLLGMDEQARELLGESLVRVRSGA